MDKFFTEASLSDSYIFRELNRSSHASTTIVAAIKTGTIVDSTFIEEQLIQCKKSRLSPLMETVLQAYETGEIKLIYNKNVRVSTSLPFVVMSIGNKTSAYIFISDFSALNKDGTALTIEMKKLYVLLEAAYIGKLYYTKPEIFLRSTMLMRIFATVYTEMSMKIFNKEFALSLNKDLYDKVSYSIARFELERMAGMRNDSVINSYAIGTCNNPSRIAMEAIEREYTSASITSLKELISFISSLSSKMIKLNARYYLERWITTYGTGATMSIDAFPYLNYVIANGLLGCFLVNTTRISDIVKNCKGINLYYSELLKLS